MDTVPLLMTKQHKEQARVERNNELGSSRKPGSGGDEQREQMAQSLCALVVCLVGILLGWVELVTPFFMAPTTAADVSIQAVGILLGILGYHLGTRRLTIVSVGLVSSRSSCRQPGPDPRYPGRRPQPPLRRAGV